MFPCMDDLSRCLWCSFGRELSTINLHSEIGEEIESEPELINHTIYYVTIALVISAKFSIFISKSIYFYIFVAIAKVQCSVPFVILGKILIAALYPICIFTAGNFFDFLIFPLRSPCD